MKQPILFIFFLLVIGCQEKTSNLNIFSSQTDTLFLQTTKLKGDSLFDLGAGGAFFRDTNAWKQSEGSGFYPNYSIKYPDSVNNIELGLIIVMFDSLTYFDSATKQILKQQNYSLADREILMIKGFKNNKEIFIVDQNNNKDLTDDTIRVFKDWVWNSDSNLIPIQYKIDFGKIAIHETLWYKIGLSRGNLLESNSQFLLSRFTIDNKAFAIGVADDNSSTFDFHRPIMYPFMENGLSCDTLIKGDLVKLGEYIKLGKTHYQFAKLYNGSGTIVLVKANNFSRLEGTQIGMIAPFFKIKTITGKQYSSKDLYDKPILIANFSGCTKSSYNQYKRLIEQYAKRINIVGVEYQINENIGGLIADVKDSVNSDFYKIYRNAYSSYVCYLIKEKRIIDKFEIYDWEKALRKHIMDKN